VHFDHTPHPDQIATDAGIRLVWTAGEENHAVEVQQYRREQVRAGKVPVSTKLIQGVGAIPDTFKNFAFNTFLLFFYNQVLGMPAGLASIALGIAVVFDAFTDPIIGSVSDNLRSRLGRRHPLMYLAAAPLALSLYLIFMPPDAIRTGDEYTLFAWLLVFAILVRGAMTLFLVPWTALMAELSDDYVERTTIVTYRYLIGWIAGASFTVFTYTFIFPSSEAYTPGHLNPDAYPTFALVVSCLVFLAIVFTTHFSRREVPYLIQPVAAGEKFSFGRVFGELLLALRNREFLIVFSAVLIGSAIGGGIGALEIYINTYFWGLTPEDLRWFPLSIIGALLAFTAVTSVQKRFDKKYILISAFLFLLIDGIFMICLRFLDVLPPNGSTLLLAILVGNSIIRTIVGTVYGIMGASIMADILDYQEYRTGHRQEGMFFSAISFSGKAVSGLGIVIAGLIIDLLAFPRGAIPGDVPADMIVDLGIAAGIGLPLLYLIPFGLFTMYRLTRTEHERIHAELEQRRERNHNGDFSMGEITELR
jgi:Na+/melibiose symporter-like transporter